MAFASGIKVLFVIDSFATGGAEKSLLAIIPHLEKVIPIVCGLYKDDSLLVQYRSTGAKVFHFNLSGKYDWKNAFSMLSQVIEDEKPQIIHSSLYRSNILSRYTARRYKLPLINSFVSDSYGDLRKSQMTLQRRLKLKATMLVDKFTAGSVDLFIANSRSVGDANSSFLGIPKEKVVVIYRGRDSSVFEPAYEGEISSLRTELEINSEHFVFLTVGRLIKGKGHLDILKAFSQMSHAWENVKVLIAGDGPEREALLTEVSKFELNEKVVLLGNRNDVPVLLKLAHAFVFPSYYEGHSGALIEAMLSGCPILASNIGPNAETINDSTGVLFPVGDIDGLMKAMTFCIQNYSEMKMKSSAALSDAREKFEIRQVARSHEKIYHSLVR